MLSAILVEFIGTSYLLGIISFVGDPVFVVSSFALVTALGRKASGAHFNPAVTAMELITGKISKTKGAYYMLAQFTAAIFIYVLGYFVQV
jgi:glycerol uptake facilitator-like aquaporin